MTSTKDAYYFPHDANARSDEKILHLLAEFGLEGYGLYWVCIEAMHEQKDGKLSLKLQKGFAYSNNVDITLLQKFYNTCIEIGLFVTDGDKYWSNRVLQNMMIREEKRNKKSIAGKRGMQSRWEKDNSVITGDNSVITEDNKGKERIGEESKEKEIKGKDSDVLVGAEAPTPSKEELIEKMLKRKEQFVNTVEPFKDVYGEKTIEQFIDYWTEPNKSQTKFRQELEKTWKLDSRLRTWVKNEVNFKNYGKDRGSNRADERWEALGQLGSSIDLSGI